MPNVSSKRIREKAEAVKGYLGKFITLRIDEKRNSPHKTPLRLHKREAIIRDCTANYVNLETLDEDQRVVQGEWDVAHEEEMVVSLIPGKKVSIPIEDLKVAYDLEKNRLMVIVNREVWEAS